MAVKPRSTVTVTFSVSPELARQLRQMAQEEERTVSELLREAIRLYQEEREWRRRERQERLRARMATELEDIERGTNE